MTEMTTGQRSFDDYKYDSDLVIMIHDFGLRPKFAPGTPDCYKLKINKNKSGSKIKMQLEIIQNIKKQFLESDEISKTLPTISENSNNIYTSKSYNTLECGARLSKIYATKTANDIEVQDDY
ncbi:hypothetical protein C2G38_2160573 [Gigaspora rosea]|uniref:Uncharacterized protein n=1 Tax=Gigaspora rosea TaxID=44941 RepID=A0A397VY05_9GLOM|nr:hypothetical protein C2G38_2160573 [Gigaspora rosea]